MMNLKKYFSWSLLLKIPNYLFIVAIKLFRPLLGPASCKFYPTCGNYAVQQLQEQNIFRALWLITKQLLACSPLTR